MKKNLSILIVAFSLISCANIDSTISKRYVANPSHLLELSVSSNPGINIPDKDYQRIKAQIKDGLSKNELLASDASKAQHLVEVTIHSYNIRDDAARIGVGQLAGCDHIISSVIITDKRTKAEVGNLQSSMNECTPIALTSQIIKKYTNGIIDFISNK